MAARNAGHQLGQQCCPMPNMANSRRQHKGEALARATKRSIPAPIRRGFLPWSATFSGPRDRRRCNGRSWLRAAIRVTVFKMNFASDNTAPMAPAILDAIVKANTGFARGYGNDDWTAGVERRLADVFEHEVAVFLVPTGTAANALALAQVTPPWGVVFCHAESHIATDECGAPEFFGGGLKLAGLAGGDGKIAPQTLASGAGRLWRSQPAPDGRFGAVAHAGERGRHHLSHRRDRDACARSRMRARSPCTWTARASPMPWSGSTPRRRR